MIEITEARLKELERSEKILEALNEYDVSDWSFYEDAVREIHKADRLEESMNNVLSGIERIVRRNIKFIDGTSAIDLDEIKVLLNVFVEELDNER